MRSWDEENESLFSSWSDERVNQMERGHEVGVSFAMDIFRILFPRLDARVLDLGCGSGHLCFHLLKEYPPLFERGQVIGLDISKKMISRAKETKAKLNLEFKGVPNLHPLRFIQGEFTCIASKLGVFNFIISLESIYYMNCLEKALRSIYDILAVEGIFLLMLEEGMLATGDQVIDEQRLAFLKNEININSIHFIQLDDYKEFLRAASFKNIETKFESGFVFILAHK